MSFHQMQVDDKATHNVAGTNLGEAAALYGDIQTAEDFGYVTRGYVSLKDDLTRWILYLTFYSLKSRHIQFIALGGTIGTGLFLGIGKAFSQAGPLSLLLGYSFTGAAIYAMVSPVGRFVRLRR